VVERVNGRLKDEFGGRFVRVRGAIKVKCHLMFGILEDCLEGVCALESCGVDGCAHISLGLGGPHGAVAVGVLGSRPAATGNCCKQSQQSSGNTMRGMRCGVQPLRMLTRTCPFNVCHSLSQRDFLFPDADEKSVPEVLAYIHSHDVETLNTLLLTQTPEEVVATFPYLSELEKKFACRALFDQWAGRLVAGSKPLLPHLMEWMARQRFNGHAGDDTPRRFRCLIQELWAKLKLLPQCNMRRVKYSFII
jgi:hypothetical protein